LKGGLFLYRVRQTDAFSKKVEDHARSVALLAYNFARVHKKLRTTPATTANVTERIWEMNDILDML
jgi:hypothetical protein